MNVSFSLDIIPRGWLGSKHQLTKLTVDQEVLKPACNGHYLNVQIDALLFLLTEAGFPSVSILMRRLKCWTCIWMSIYIRCRGRWQQDGVPRISPKADVRKGFNFVMFSSSLQILRVSVFVLFLFNTVLRAIIRREKRCFRRRRKLVIYMHKTSFFLLTFISFLYR